MRCFIAIDVDDEFFKKIQEKIDISNVNLKFTSRYHLTLKFLGDVGNVFEIKERLEKIKFLPFEMIVDNISFFSNEKSPNVVWAGIEKNNQIMELQKEIDSVFPEFPSEHNFHPHITLARVREVVDRDKFKENINSIKLEKKFKVNCFKLFKSTLTSSGPVYEQISAYMA